MVKCPLFVYDAGADVNSCTACKDSALHLASFRCTTQNVTDGLSIITLLFEAGTLTYTYIQIIMVSTATSLLCWPSLLNTIA